MKTAKVDQLVDLYLAQANVELANKLTADVLFCRTDLTIGVDDQIRIYVEEVCDGRPGPIERLAVLIETPGGFIETVERIYAVFRHHYRHVDFIVPSYAYSAGTVLVLSGDEIYMDYYSILGPIDPQIEGGEGEWVPGLGYLHKYRELMDAVNCESSRRPLRSVEDGLQEERCRGRCEGDASCNDGASR